MQERCIALYEAHGPSAVPFPYLGQKRRRGAANGFYGIPEFMLPAAPAVAPYSIGPDAQVVILGALAKWAVDIYPAPGMPVVEFEIRGPAENIKHRSGPVFKRRFQWQNFW